MQVFVDAFLVAVLVVGIVAGGIIVTLLAVRHFGSGSGGLIFKPPDTGVDIVEGRPGSGKSFFAVGELLNAVLRERRPVYTNLPIRWRVFREYVRRRGGPELAGLVYQLTEEHFRAFLARTRQLADFNDAWRARKASWIKQAEALERAGDRGRAMRLRRLAIRRFSEARRERAFVATFGPAVYSGSGANWIHPTSVVCIDEAHKWFPQEEQRSESGDLRGYLTMHRHQLHRVIVVTQDRMQVNISFRRQCRAYWHVRDRGEDRLPFNLRFKHLGIKAFGYCKWTPEQEAASRLEDRQPSEQITVFPWVPWERWKFRLYDSYTHAGGRRGLLRARAEARRATGLDEDGLTDAEELAMAAAEAERRERRKPHRVLRWIGRQCRKAAVLALVGAVGYLIGLGDAGSSAGTAGGSGGAGGTDGAAAVAGQVAPTGWTAEAGAVWGKWTGHGPGFVRVDGERVNVGGKRHGMRLELVDVRERVSVWSRDGDLWLWRYRDAAPERLGPAARVAEAVRAEAARRGWLLGTAVMPDGAGFGAAVGVREGDVVRGESAVLGSGG